MAAATKKDPFAKIEVGLGQTGRPRVIHFSRFQFEVVMVLLPAVVVWGLVSTGLLLYQLLRHPIPMVQSIVVQESPKLETKPAESLPKALPQSVIPEVGKINGVKVPANPVSGHSVSATKIKYTASRFLVEDAFAVSATVTSSSLSGPFKLALDIENLTGQLERGHLWARVNALLDNGQEVVLYSSPAITIGADGRIQNPKKGVAFSFQRFLQRSLPLYGDHQSKVEIQSINLKTLELGFDRKNRGQSAATVDLKVISN
jgi:hypothetical protein